MRTIWNGSINFGLVNIPVGLALATKPAARQSDVSFRTLHRECGTPIKQKRWCPVHDREVSNDELVKGWEVSKGEFVFVEDADLEAIAQYDDSRAIEITSFVPLDQIDPVFFDRTYYLAPSSTPAQRRPYVLLLRALQESDMGAVGRFVLRGQENFSLIRPRGDALALETLFVAEDVRSQAEVEEAVGDTEVKEAELELARQVIDSLAARLRSDRARERVPEHPPRDAAGEARRPGDQAAGARGGGDAGHRPDGGAPPERRRGTEAEEARLEVEGEELRRCAQEGRRRRRPRQVALVVLDGRR